MAAGRNATASAILAGALALILQSAGPASANGKMDRQIEMFERVVDDVLVESPNWLVQSRKETRGRYRSGEGAVFRADASLVGGRSFGAGFWKGWWDDGDDVIVIDRDDLDDLDKKDLEEAFEKSDRWNARRAKYEERLYTRGKAELVEALMDYGDLLTALADDESVVLELDLGSVDLFEDKDLSTLRVSAKMGDLRAFGDGKIDEKAMKGRVHVKES